VHRGTKIAGFEKSAFESHAVTDRTTGRHSPLLTVQPFSQNPALQQLQKSSKSASTTPQRPIWNSFATVGVRDFWENGCTLREDRRISSRNDCLISQIIALARSEVAGASIRKEGMDHAEVGRIILGMRVDYTIYSELVCRILSQRCIWPGLSGRGGDGLAGRAQKYLLPFCLSAPLFSHLPPVPTTPSHGLVTFLPATNPPLSPPHLHHHHPPLPPPAASLPLPLRRCLPAAASSRCLLPRHRASRASPHSALLPPLPSHLLHAAPSPPPLGPGFTLSRTLSAPISLDRMCM